MMVEDKHAIKDIPIVDNDDDKEEEKMEDDKEEEKIEEESTDPRKSIVAFKKVVVKTLEENKMSDKRAVKMEIMDFLNLLEIFNE